MTDASRRNRRPRRPKPAGSRGSDVDSLASKRHRPPVWVPGLRTGWPKDPAGWVGRAAGFFRQAASWCRYRAVKQSLCPRTGHASKSLRCPPPEIARSSTIGQYGSALRRREVRLPFRGKRGAWGPIGDTQRDVAAKSRHKSFGRFSKRRCCLSAVYRRVRQHGLASPQVVAGAARRGYSSSKPDPLLAGQTGRS